MCCPINTDMAVCFFFLLKNLQPGFCVFFSLFRLKVNVPTVVTLCPLPPQLETLVEAPVFGQLQCQGGVQVPHKAQRMLSFHCPIALSDIIRHRSVKLCPPFYHESHSPFKMVEKN